MVTYTPEPVNETGIRFKLEEGNIGDLYDTIISKLDNLYTDWDYIVKLPNKPSFNSLPKNETVKLDPITLGKDGAYNPALHGWINLRYFASQKRNMPGEDVDYPVHVSESKNYESLTIFFNTQPKNFPAEGNLKEANEAQRDIFLLNLEDRL